MTKQERILKAQSQRCADYARHLTREIEAKRREVPAGIAANAVPMFHALRRIQIESSPEAEATPGDLRRALLQVNRLAGDALKL